MWLDPQGMIALKIMRDGADMNGPGEQVAAETDPQKKAALEKKLGDPDAEIAQLRQELADNGPSAIRPTPEWLAGLPADPAALRALLLGDTGANKWSDDHRLFTAVSDLLINAEPILDAGEPHRPLRGAGHHRPADRAGHHGRAACGSTRSGTPRTARSTRSSSTRPPAGSSAAGRATRACPRRPRRAASSRRSTPGSAYRAVSTYEIVSAVGER